jgi:hypothetical protein
VAARRHRIDGTDRGRLPFSNSAAEGSIVASSDQRRASAAREIDRLRVLPPCELMAPTRPRRRGPSPEFWPEQLEAQAWLAAAGGYVDRRRARPGA